MEASELRIGNYVEHENSDFNQESEIVVVDINILSFINETQDYKEKYLMYHAIDIDEDWLIKFGAEKSKDEFGGWLLKINNTESIRITTAISSTFAWPLYGHSIVKLNYVHSIQNLFHALTGQELTITNP
jgi:hypothetical protein